MGEIDMERAMLHRISDKPRQRGNAPQIFVPKGFVEDAKTMSDRQLAEKYKTTWRMVTYWKSKEEQ